ncbi:xylanase [Pseudomassariella vexata]|uniref:Xylanase n=1 Tax=Pseudomassariella vexata TaxID=1141098 RepID=A0A1Y2E4U3_9PEZI|nr:xylanase [Pseudomassariella vexata]ORY66542.1 xylanase [Pseudomassariella vexata]
MFNVKAAVVIWASIGLSLAQTQVTVNVGSTLQKIDGFGVSQAFGRAAEFQALAEGPRRKGLDYLFNTTTGAGFTIIRNRIGSKGADSILPNSPGSPTADPKYVWDRNDSGQVWFSKEAMGYGVKNIYADAWSAPGFMKTNGNEANGGYLCGVTGQTCSSGDWRQAFANMLAQYVKYYQEEGIQVSHLGFLNEPDYTTSYSSMRSDGAQAASFIPTLSKTLQSNNLSSVALACCDNMGWGTTRTTASALISAGMESYLTLLTSHNYNGDPNSVISTRLKTWQTEACDLQSRWCTTWYSNGGACEGLTWAGKIATGILNANLSAYIYWQGVEVNQQQASSYLVLSDGTEVFPSGRLWAMAMWSRFIRPGAYRVATSGSVSGVSVGAFKNTDGSVVGVLTNTGGSSQNVKLALNGFTPNAAGAWLTDNSHQVAGVEVTLDGSAVTVAVPARSVVTVKLTEAS